MHRTIYADANSRSSLPITLGSTCLLVGIGGALLGSQKRRRSEEEEERERQEALDRLFYDNDMLDDDLELAETAPFDFGPSAQIALVEDSTELLAADIASRGWTDGQTVNPSVEHAGPAPTPTPPEATKRDPLTGATSLLPSPSQTPRIDKPEEKTELTATLHPHTHAHDYVSSHDGRSGQPFSPGMRSTSQRKSRSVWLWLAFWCCLGGGLLSYGVLADRDRTGTAPVVAAQSEVEYVTKSIQDLQPGDIVVARDEHGNQVARKEVLETYERVSDHLRLLVFEDDAGQQQRLETTDEHPFWVEELNRFAEAKDLQPGQTVVGPSGETQQLVSTAREEHPDGIPVYNFQVADFHTYYVLQDGLDATPVWVHNAKYAPKGALHGPLKPNVLTRADSILDAARPTFKSNWATKVTNKYSWLRDRIPGTKTLIEGSRSQKLAQAQKIIMDRVGQGGGTIVDHVGAKAIKYVDGGVSYFFRLDGTFWGIRKNI
ncbi:MAG: hypothetical protein GY854_12360 [Deltaproteobacteria bacterium]|nr:hypothetical protein [Deltaproteobacteria bacterium]